MAIRGLAYVKVELGNACKVATGVRAQQLTLHFFAELKYPIASCAKTASHRNDILQLAI